MSWYGDCSVLLLWAVSAALRDVFNWLSVYGSVGVVVLWSCGMHNVNINIHFNTAKTNRSTNDT